MTGYQSKRAAAQARTIDEVNWADHEPDGRMAAQEPESCNGSNCAASIKNDFKHSNECIVDTAKEQGWSYAPEAIKAAIALGRVVAQPEQETTLQEEDRKRGSIALARSLCYEINGAADGSDDMDGGGYGSVDIAEILSAEIVRLQAALAQTAQEPTLEEQLDKAGAAWRKAGADRDKAGAAWVKANADRAKAYADRDKADADLGKARAEINCIKNLME